MTPLPQHTQQKRRSAERTPRTTSGWLLIVVITLVVACARHTRCGTCGMKIDPASAWVGYITVDGEEKAFDTPRCAYTAWRKAGTHATAARFRDYYSQEIRDASELRFVHGSDVVGPMGPDLVPVVADHAARFAHDHNGAPPQTAQDLLRGELP